MTGMARPTESATYQLFFCNFGQLLVVCSAKELLLHPCDLCPWRGDLCRSTEAGLCGVWAQLMSAMTNAGLTLQSAAIRRKPNAFNLLHQLLVERKCKGRAAADSSLEAAWVLFFRGMSDIEC